MPQGVPSPKWLKVGQVVRRPGESGKFGVVVGVYGHSARVSVDGRIALESIHEVQRYCCRDKFCKVFHGEDNCGAEVFLETNTGSWKLSPQHERLHFANRFWWGIGRDETYVARRRQLAAVILEKTLPDTRMVDLLADRFGDEIIAKLSPKRFYLTEFEIREWAENASAELAAEGASYALQS